MLRLSFKNTNTLYSNFTLLIDFRWKSSQDQESKIFGQAISNGDLTMGGKSATFHPEDFAGQGKWFPGENIHLPYLYGGFHKLRVPQNGWFIMDNPIKIGWFGGTPHFKKPPYTWWVSSSIQRSASVPRGNGLSSLFTFLLWVMYSRNTAVHNEPNMGFQWDHWCWGSPNFKNPLTSQI